MNETLQAILALSALVIAVVQVAITFVVFRSSKDFSDVKERQALLEEQIGLLQLRLFSMQLLGDKLAELTPETQAQIGHLSWVTEKLAQLDPKLAGIVDRKADTRRFDNGRRLVELFSRKFEVVLRALTHLSDNGSEADYVAAIQIIDARKAVSGNDLDRPEQFRQLTDLLDAWRINLQNNGVVIIDRPLENRRPARHQSRDRMPFWAYIIGTLAIIAIALSAYTAIQRSSAATTQDSVATTSPPSRPTENPPP